MFEFIKLTRTTVANNESRKYNQWKIHEGEQESFSCI